jgi:hypothetical protein
MYFCDYREELALTIFGDMLPALDNFVSYRG